MDWNYEVVMIPVCVRCMDADELTGFAKGVLFDSVRCSFCGRTDAQGLVRVYKPKHWKEVKGGEVVC